MKTPKSILPSLLSTLLLAASYSWSDGPVISEFMAVNAYIPATNPMDIDTTVDGVPVNPDWIEIHNTNPSSSLSLDGWYLTDDSKNLTKWQFPASATIGPNGYKVVWTTRKTQEENPGNYPYVDNEGYLHTNFQLNQSGEYLALVAPDGLTIVQEFNKYPNQRGFISYGIDSAGTVGYLQTPTPGSANGSAYAGVVADTKFNIDRGFFTNAIDVVITCETPGATIRYTLDASTPTASHGTVYSPGSPIDIDSTTYLRAAAFMTDWLPTEVDTHTYLFLADVITQSPDGQSPGGGWPSGTVNGQVFDYGMDPDVVNDPTYGPQMLEALQQIQTVSLVTDFDNLVGSSNGIYVNAGGEGIGWERPVSAELINPDGSKGFQVNAGLRIRGAYSRTGSNPKHSFRLLFKGGYGPGKLEYPVFGDEGVDEFDNLDLRTAQNYAWSNWGNDGARNTILRDVYSRDMQRETGKPYTRSRYYHLYLNGQYWGLYQSQERSEASYAESYFGGYDEYYDVIKTDGYATSYTDGTLDEWNYLWNLCEQGFNTDEKYYAVQGKDASGNDDPLLPVHVDVENLIDYMMGIFFTGNRDAPITLSGTAANNFYAIRDRRPEARQGWVFFAYDGEHNMLSASEDRTQWFSAGSQIGHFNPQWLHQKLMDNTEYRMRFADQAHKHFFNDGVMTTAKSTALIQQRIAEISLAIIGESARWGDQRSDRADNPYTKADWWNEANGFLVNQFLSGRTQTVLNQLKNRSLYPQVGAPSFNQHGGYVDPGFEVTMSAAAGTIYYTLDGSDPRLSGGTINPTAVAFTPDAPTIGSVDLVEESSAEWNYLYDGSDQGTAWRQLSFADGAWGSGPGELGFGDGDEITVIGPKVTGQMSAYFRHEFTVSTLTNMTQLKVDLKYDDGAVIYINDQEVARVDMPASGITTAPLAHWKLDDGSGAVAADETGNYDGFLSGTTWTAGIDGGALSFNGFGDHVNCGAVPAAGQMSFSAWINPTTTSGLQGIFGKDASCSIRMNGTELTYTKPGTADYDSFGMGLTPGVWQHIAVTIDGGAPNGLKFYKNGVLIFERSAEGPSANSNPLFLGNNQWNQEFGGLMDEPQIFAAVLTAADVAALHANNYATVDYLTAATGGAKENATAMITGIDPSVLNIGQNIIAVEIHQSVPDSSDLSFDLNLEAETSIPGGSGGSEPIALTGTTQIKARALSGGDWSALNDAIFAVDPIAENLRITEIMYHPQNDTNELPNAEYIEFQNIGTNALNLNLARLTKGVDFTFPPLIVPPNDYVVVVRDAAAFAAAYPGFSGVIAGVWDTGDLLKNSGEKIRLKDALGTVVQNFDYKDSWYDITDGEGFSLTIKDAASTNLALWDEKAGWRPSALSGGSPGYDDSAQTIELGAIVINEVLSHSHAEAPDWIELYNTTGNGMDLGGWFLSDDNSGGTNTTKYEIPLGTVIPANGYLVFYENTTFGNASAPGCHAPFGLSEGDDQVYLHSGSAGEITGYVEEEDFGAAETSISFGRYYKASTDSYNFVAMSANTPGAANAGPKVGPVVITEIMYNPETQVGDSYGNDEYEYVKIRNITGSPVTLQEYDDLLSINVPWMFDNGIDYTFPLGTTIPAGGSLVVAKNLSAYAERYGSSSGIFGPYAGKLSNSGEKVDLSKPGDDEGLGRYYILVDRVNYSDGTHPLGTDPWPASTDGTGFPLVRINDSAYGNDVANWQGPADADGDGIPDDVDPDDDNDGIPDTSDPDDDNDGIPDTWEMDHSGSNTGLDANTQTGDNDGYSHLEEFMLNFDPAVSNAPFGIVSIQTSPSVAIIFGETSAERSYTVEYSTNLIHGVGWQVLQPNVTGSNETTLVNDPTTNAHRYYRVLVP